LDEKYILTYQNLPNTLKKWLNVLLLEENIAEKLLNLPTNSCTPKKEIAFCFFNNTNTI